MYPQAKLATMLDVSRSLAVAAAPHQPDERSMIRQVPTNAKAHLRGSRLRASTDRKLHDPQRCNRHKLADTCYLAHGSWTSLPKATGTCRRIDWVNKSRTVIRGPSQTVLNQWRQPRPELCALGTMERQPNAI